MDRYHDYGHRPRNTDKRKRKRAVESDTPETSAEAGEACVVRVSFAKRLERERDEARHTASALNRRLTKAQGIIDTAHLVENRPTKGGGGLGRALANYSADKYMRERDEAREKLSHAQALLAEMQDALKLAVKQLLKKNDA